MRQLVLLAAVVGAALISTVTLTTAAPQKAAASATEAAPSWIWHGQSTDTQEATFRKSFEIAGTGEKAIITGSCDNHMTVLLNGKTVLSHDTWERLISKDVSASLVKGKNVIEVQARNAGGPAGLALRLTIGAKRSILTDGSWKCASPQDAKAGKWANATVIGPVGAGNLPWTAVINAASYGGKVAQAAAHKTVQDSAPPQKAEAAPTLQLPDGFKAEKLYTVPKPIQGSWVALTTDDKGRLYASDQGGKGLYRITPAKIGDANAVTEVEKINVSVSGAQGMTWAFDSLYINVNGQGVWRITDTDGDDQLDKAVNIIKLGGGGEHGPHAIIPTRDGKQLYFLGGNHTNPPAFDSSRSPSNWKEDLLLPRQWDARGHARGKLAPGGWIATCDPDGSNIEIISNGYRNQYDMALSRQGELFTFDADMEWDVGSPWYRPTRVCQVTSGSEFGWRSGTGKWPAYYEDSLPPVVNIGPGSPTGVVFGTGAKFPARYQDALYILDWTFGTIYAIHLEPDGAGYTAVKEHFCWDKPLAVTDAIVGKDGALYFTVGGRGSQSALYRVIYTGNESSAPLTSVTADAGTQARKERLALEAFHGGVDAKAVASAWPYLSNQDRFLRFAARIAIENQPVARWRRQALTEKDNQAAVIALIALARQGSPQDLSGIIAALDRLDLAGLPKQQELAALRAYAIAFARMGQPDAGERTAVMAKLEPLFPASSDEVNTELSRILTYLQSPMVVRKTLALMKNAAPTELPPWAELIKRNDRYGGPIAAMLDNMPPLQNITYAFILRNATEGWTMSMRKAYFGFFVKAAGHPGGNSYAGFLRNIRTEAMATLTVSEQRTLAPILGQSLVAELPKNITAPKGPGREWTHAAAVEVIGANLSGRNFNKGRNLFHATTCSACHRFAGEGGAIGPDLTTVANKFSVTDILDSIIHPSKVISDQYGSSIVLDKDGTIVEGLLVEDEDQVSVYPNDHTAPPIVLKRSEIAAIKASSTSQMPTALINTLNPAELKDLVAYLLSGGNKNAKVFRKPAAAGKK